MRGAINYQSESKYEKGSLKLTPDWLNTTVHVRLGMSELPCVSERWGKRGVQTNLYDCSLCVCVLTSIFLSSCLLTLHSQTLSHTVLARQ